MRLQKFGHSCVLVEEGESRLLLDPGGFSQGYDDLAGLTGVLITHQHFDHLDVDGVQRLLERNPDARLIADEAGAAQLGDAGLSAEAVHDGDELEVGGVNVRVIGSEHAVIHPDLPTIPNVGFLVAGRFFHPGDAFTVPGQPVEVLALPAEAPWMKLAEAVDFMRAVNPAVAVPIHDAVIAAKDLYYGFYEQLAAEGTQLRNIDDGQPADF